MVLTSDGLQQGQVNEGHQLCPLIMYMTIFVEKHESVVHENYFSILSQVKAHANHQWNLSFMKIIFQFCPK